MVKTTDVLAQYAFWAKKKAEKGEVPRLPAGLSDVFNVFKKHGARANAGILARLRKVGVDTFHRRSRCKNFDKVAMFIIANVDLETRTFSRNGGTQSQMADMLGMSQSTISRILTLMIQMGVIRHAFLGNSPPSDVKAGLVHDSKSIPLNCIYFVNDDFGYLAGPTAGNKLRDVFTIADDQAVERSGLPLYSRLLIVRNTLWEGTISRRIKNISKGCIKSTIKKITDRSRASSILTKRAERRGDLFGLTDYQVTAYINILLESCGFGSSGGERVKA